MAQLVIRAEQIPQRLEVTPQLGPLTILVPDFADPCGTHRIPRTVQAAYPADVWDHQTGRYTRGRWQIVFAGDWLHPMILVTPGTHRYQITSDHPGARGGPCAECRAHAHRLAAQRAAQAAERDQVDRARRAVESAATRAGYHHGYAHAAFVDAYGAQHDAAPSVPPGHASLATFYLSGWDDGVHAYTDEQDWS